MLALQQMMPMIAEIGGANQTVKIEQITLLSGGGDDGSLARRAIATAEQIRSATGIDLPELFRRFGGGEAAPALPAAPASPPPPPGKARG